MIRGIVSIGLRRLLAWALWLWLVSFTFVGLQRAIGDGDECVHASALRDMMRSGDYLHLRYHGMLTLERPLLPYWLAAPFAKLIPDEPGLRMSSALASFATLLVVFWVARRVFRRGDAAFVAVLLLAGSPSFHAYSRTLMSDPPMIFALSLAIAGALLMLEDARFVSLAIAGVGLAIACKSLIVAIPALALLPWIAFVFIRRADSAIRWRACAWFALTALPYYVLGFVLHGERFWREHFLHSLVSRAGNSYGIGIPEGPWSFVRWIWHSEGPLTAAWLALGIVGGVAWGIRRGRKDLLMLGSFALSVLVLMSCLGTRLPHYILPAYPAAALAVAGLYAALTEQAGFAAQRFSVLLGPTLAMLVLLASRMYPGGDEYLLQRESGRTLGLIAQHNTKPGQTLYAYEWLAPSLKLYADRPVMMLTSMRKRYEIVKPFVESLELVPPAPEPAGSSIVIAGDADSLSHAAWLQVDDVLGFSAPFFLARAHVLALPKPPPPPTAAAPH